MTLDKFEELVGHTLNMVERTKDEVIFTLENGDKYRLNHEQDCCESVSLEDVCGDLLDLVGSPIIRAEERISREPTDEIKAEREAEEAKQKAEQGESYYRWDYESETWTFYEIATNKGSVTIRWYGTSNGYYSETVYFEKV